MSECVKCPVLTDLNKFTKFKKHNKNYFCITFLYFACARVHSFKTCFIFVSTMQRHFLQVSLAETCIDATFLNDTSFPALALSPVFHSPTIFSLFCLLSSLPSSSSLLMVILSFASKPESWTERFARSVR